MRSSPNTKGVLKRLLGRVGLARFWGGEGSVRSELARGASGTFALNIVHTGLSFATSVVLTRLLGAEGYGRYAYVMSWVLMLLEVATVGLPKLITRELARYNSRGAYNYVKGMIKWADVVVLLVSVIVSVAAILATTIFPWVPDTQTQYAFWTGMVLLPFLSLIRLRRSSLRGLGAIFKALLAPNAILPLAFLVIVIISTTITSLTPTTSLLYRIAAAGIALAVATYYLFKVVPSEVKVTQPSYKGRDWFRSAMPLLFVSGVGMFDNTRISVILLGSMIGPEAAGVFRIASKAALVLKFVRSAVEMPLGPKIAEFYHMKETKDLQRLTTKSARVILIGSLPVIAGLVVFGEWLLLVFGETFTVGATALSLLTVGFVVSFFVGPVRPLLNMTGNERATAKGVAVASVVNLVLNVLFIDLWGINGAAFAVVLSMTAWNVVLSISVYWRLDVNSTVLGKVK